METQQSSTEKQAPKITQAEVTKWENEFREVVSPLVKFDTQDNGFSMKFYNGESGVDAYWSGTVILKSDNYIKWTFSVLNGVFVEIKMNIDENNQKISSNLYDFFKSWQEEVSKTLTEPQEKDVNATNPPAQTPDLVGPETNNAPEAPAQGPPPITEGMILSNTPSKQNNTSKERVNQIRKNNIMDSGERMRRLAGL